MGIDRRFFFWQLCNSGMESIPSQRCYCVFAVISQSNLCWIFVVESIWQAVGHWNVAFLWASAEYNVKKDRRFCLLSYPLALFSVCRHKLQHVKWDFNSCAIAPDCWAPGLGSVDPCGYPFLGVTKGPRLLGPGLGSVDPCGYPFLGVMKMLHDHKHHVCVCIEKIPLN